MNPRPTLYESAAERPGRVLKATDISVPGLFEEAPYDGWASRSLSGVVDFHALASSQGTTYGWDAGTGRPLGRGSSGTGTPG